MTLAPGGRKFARPCSAFVENGVMSEPRHLVVAPASKWFVRGFAVAILLVGAINAMSYFVRSDGPGNLVGTHSERREAVGFPWELWERGNAYNGFYVDYAAVGANVFSGVLLGAVCGLVAAGFTGLLNRIGERLEAEMQQGQRRASVPLQFSLRGLLATTAVAAVIAAIWRSSLSARPEVLAAIYLLGPLVLVVIALIPGNMSWQQRVAVIIPLTLMLIGAAVGIGGRLPNPLEFDQVLLGIFVCWTPQSVLSALALTCMIFVKHAFPWRNVNAT